MHANTNGNIPHLNFEDLNYENKPYNDFLAYGDAKLRSHVWIRIRKQTTR